MALTAQRLYKDIRDRVEMLTSVGISIDNMIIHPYCQPDAPKDLKTRRRAEWGFKILGAFVGTDQFVIDALNQEMKTFQGLTDVMLRYLSVQAS